MSYKHIADGEIYAFDQQGTLRVAYLYKLPGGGIRIRSENSNEYPDELLTRKDFTRIKILGRIFWWTSIRHTPHS
ncbi:HTH-type transcriptional regulator PrtR [compost metagenome]